MPNNILEVLISVPVQVGVLIGVITIICYMTFKFRYIFLIISRKIKSKVFPPKGLSAALAQGIFSTSSAWKLERLDKYGLDGTGTVIAILDTAIDLTCHAFDQKCVVIHDCLPNIQKSSISHGSICAAIAVGQAYSSPSIYIPRGVAPGAHLIVYRIAEGEHCTSYNAAVLRALDDIKEKILNGTQKVDVVSISYDLNEDAEEDISKKIEALTNMGVVFVAAVGNRGGYQSIASIPARFKNVISVGSLDKYGDKSKFNPRVRIDVFAPGEDIPALSATSDKMFGTSLAAPAVGGLVLILKQLANKAGSSVKTKDDIHRVDILRTIFDKHMMTKSDSNDLIFTPVEFLIDLEKEPSLWNEVIFPQSEPMEQ